MNQRDLNRAVARATGETVERIARMGFSLMPERRPFLVGRVQFHHQPRKRRISRPGTSLAVA